MKKRHLLPVSVLLLCLLLCPGLFAAENPEQESGSEVLETETPETEDAVLQELSGHWVDINSDMVLDFEGDQATFTQGDYWQQTFTVSVSDFGDYAEIRNADDYWGFLFISSLTFDRKKKVLTAFELVLDADGHKFRFVREEELEKELAVQDNSKDLPKTIQSREIKEFEFVFSLRDTRYDVANSAHWPYGTYDMQLERSDDGMYQFYYRIMGDSYIVYSCEKEVSGEFAEGLADLIVSLDVPAYNGRHLSNNENFPGWWIYVTYASGEKISESADGRPSLECPFSILAFLEYMDQVVDLEN